MRLATPALDAWRRRGDVALRDAVWVAASEERTAVELAAMGCTDGARAALARAERVVEAAAHCALPGCAHRGADCLRAREMRGPGLRRAG